MKIRTQFIMTVCLAGVILAIISASAIITSQRVLNITRQQETTNSLVQGAAELNYLANDYVIYGESQQLDRWQTRFASFSAQVASLRVNNAEQAALLTNVQAATQRLKEVFDSIAPAVSSQNGQVADLSLVQSRGAGCQSRARGLSRTLPDWHNCSKTRPTV